MTNAPKPSTFATQARFRAWLSRNHARESELIVRCFKVHALDRGIGYRQALDEALCFGWIDGVRRSHDADSFTQRFTPRRAKSYWSSVNIKRYKELLAEGRVRAPGVAAYEARVDRGGASPYSFEGRAVELAPAFVRRLRANPAAWSFYSAQPPSYRRLTAHWVMSAKREETRVRRLATLIADSARGRRIGPLERPEAKSTRG
jgi:uncharacterized protein YdeI (YjbR/CyaY-like superfamily)